MNRIKIFVYIYNIYLQFVAMVCLFLQSFISPQNLLHCKARFSSIICKPSFKTMFLDLRDKFLWYDHHLVYCSKVVLAGLQRYLDSPFWGNIYKAITLSLWHFRSVWHFLSIFYNKFTFISIIMIEKAIKFSLFRFSLPLFMLENSNFRGDKH